MCSVALNGFVFQEQVVSTCFFGPVLSLAACYLLNRNMVSELTLQMAVVAQILS